MMQQNNKIIKRSDRLPLPESIIYRAVDDAHLFIAPENPSWIVPSETGRLLVEQMQEGATVGQAMDCVESALGVEHRIIHDEMDLLLRQIEERGFYAQKPVEKIAQLRSDGTLHMALTNKCNLNCIHCFMDAGEPMPEELSTAEWKQVVDMFTETYGPNGVTISGGEAMLRHDFFELASYVRSKGHTLFVMSNGTLIKNRQIAEKLAGVANKVQISLDGVSEESTDAVRGKGVFRQIMRAIELLKLAGVKLYLSFVVLPENVRELEEGIAAFAKTINYDKLNFRFDDHLINIGRATELSPEHRELSGMDPSAVQRILQQLWQSGWSNRPPVKLNRRLKNCGIGKGLSVTANGDIYPCSMPVHKFGNIRTDPFDEVAGRIRQLYESTDVTHMPVCAGCELRFVCTGGCRVLNKIQNSNYLIPICDEQKKMQVMRNMVNMERV